MSANLYDELQGDYQSAADQFTGAKTALLEQIGAFRASMEAKKAKTTECVPLEDSLDGAGLDGCLDAANAEIKKHIGKTANFKAAKDAATKKLETHYLSTIYDDVKDLEKKIADNKLEVDKINNGDKEVVGDVGIVGLTERIKANRAKISSSHKGCQEINSALKTFLGRDELQFEVEKEGYVLLRGKKVAENLSEGEKTAIGFVHFVIHLKDQNFDPSKGIVVVDDPVSSLDSNSIFQAFSFLKNSVKEAQQVFLLTHNFDFLRLLINWVSHSKKPGYYMIKNTYSASGERSASIDTLDKLLQKHESEYHYLFKLLHTFQSDGTIESVYNVPNIARKVLDTFLMFRVPSSETNYLKMEALKPHFDGNKLTAELMEVMDAMLRSAEWKFNKPSGDGLGAILFADKAGIIASSGVSIHVPEEHRSEWEPAVVALRDALIAEGISALAFADGANAEKGKKRDRIHVLIGSKPLN